MDAEPLSAERRLEAQQYVLCAPAGHYAANIVADLLVTLAARDREMERLRAFIVGVHNFCRQNGFTTIEEAAAELMPNNAKRDERGYFLLAAPAATPEEG